MNDTRFTNNTVDSHKAYLTEFLSKEFSATFELVKEEKVFTELMKEYETTETYEKYISGKKEALTILKQFEKDNAIVLSKDPLTWQNFPSSWLVESCLSSRRRPAP